MQNGDQVQFKRSVSKPPEPAWVGTVHDESFIDIYTLDGPLFGVSFGGGVGQWRNHPFTGYSRWVPDIADEFEYAYDFDGEKRTSSGWDEYWSEQAAEAQRESEPEAVEDSAFMNSVSDTQTSAPPSRLAGAQSTPAPEYRSIPSESGL